MGVSESPGIGLHSPSVQRVGGSNPSGCTGSDAAAGITPRPASFPVPAAPPRMPSAIRARSLHPPASLMTPATGTVRHPKGPAEPATGPDAGVFLRAVLDSSVGAKVTIGL